MMLALLLETIAAADYPEAVSACLDRIDVACAERALVAAGAHSTDPGVLAATADMHFYAGEYPEAYDAMKAAVDAGWPDAPGDLALYERTMFATAGWVEEQRTRFAVRFRPGVDAILVDDAFQAMQGSDRYISPLLGGSPPGTSRVELFPEGRSFIAASSLKTEDVQTTGVVGLAKWSRLLVTSPRALPRGYPWQDTIAHEYIHLVVTHHTADRSPVWLQEAIAKYLDARWHDGNDHFRLSVRQQGQLALALKKDDLVSFEEMHPSLAKLPTAERASLAYAQLATLMQYSFERGGEDVLLRVLPLVREGTDAREALAQGVGAPSFEALEAGWREWLARQPLVEKRLLELPTVLDGGDDLDTDPLLADREDLARFVTLGDILNKAGEVEASLAEYAKAMPSDEPASPVLTNRIAQAQLSLGRTHDARKGLEASLKDYPEFALTRKTLGQVLLKEGKPQEAIEQLRAAVAIHPFDPEIQQALVDAYGAVGDEAGVARHQADLKIRAQGGDGVVREPIHTREGKIVLPTYDSHRATEDHDAWREGWIGQDLRPFTLQRIDGRTLASGSLTGKVVVLDFWATWCGPCKEAMPELSALHDAHHGDGLEIIGVTDEDLARVKPFLAKRPVSYTIGIDPDGRAAKLYDVTALPTAFVIDRKGVIREVVVGAGKSAMSRLEIAVMHALEEP